MSGEEPEQFRKVFIGGLSYKTTEEGLRSFYSQWGELLDAVVMTDKNSGKSRGFGFVTYGDSSMVDEAMKNRPHTIDGRQVQPKRAVPREQSTHPGANVTVNKIFIGGIRDKPVTKNDLEMYFSTFGTIRDCVIMVEKETNKPRGFAFVEFDDYDPVDQIILQRQHQINGVKIDVKKALPRDGASGDTPRGGGGRGGRGASSQRGGGDGGYSRGGDGGFSRGGRAGGREMGGGGRGGGGRGMVGSDGYGNGGGGRGMGGGGGGGYGNENDYGGNYGNPNQGMHQGGWDSNSNNNDVGCNQSFGNSYPGFGQQHQQQQQMMQSQMPQHNVQQPLQPQQQQQGYPQQHSNGYGADFGQNYGQHQGGGSMKGSGNEYYGGRQAPYANNYGR